MTITITTPTINTAEPMTFERALAEVRAQAESMTIPMFHPSRPINNQTIVEPTSWLVLRHGVALFVTQSEDFMRWYLENNPGTTIEEVTGHVPEAAARTAR
jgi:hypothetical protein